MNFGKKISSGADHFDMHLNSIHIIAEGQTEGEFINQFLKEYFWKNYQVTVTYNILGGSINFQKIKTMIEMCLKIYRNSIITTMIDYYGIKNLSNFPGYTPSNNGLNNVKSMESELLKCFDSNYHWRLIPYFQLHEFEALLFSDVSAFYNISDVSQTEINQLEGILSEFKYPEHINSNIPPSHRIKRVISRYNKIIHGIEVLKKIVEKNGFDGLKGQCQHFGEWFSQLEITIKKQECNEN